MVIYTDKYQAKYFKTTKGKAALRKAQRKSREKLKQAVFEFLGAKCARCGFADPRALQIDHINGGGAKENKRIGIKGIYKNVFKNPSNYQVLCANCNWIKRYEKNETPYASKTI